MSIKGGGTSGFRKRLIISSRIPFRSHTGLFGKLRSAVYKIVLEIGHRELNFTADVLIYRIVYSHKI